jgi:hypothetical protein
MKPASIIAAILLGCALCSTAAQAQKTSSGYDQSVDFSHFRTFMFAEGQGARNPYVKQMIVAALERELRAKGLTKVDANADLRVVYLAASGFNLRVGSVSFGYAVNPVYSGMVPAGSQMWDVTTGTLLIDLFDNKTDRIVFRGTAQDVLQRAPSADAQTDARLVSKQINKGIARIFKKYPKAAKKGFQK